MSCHDAILITILLKVGMCAEIFDLRTLDSLDVATDGYTLSHSSLKHYLVGIADYLISLSVMDT